MDSRHDYPQKDESSMRATSRAAGLSPQVNDVGRPRRLSGLRLATRGRRALTTIGFPRPGILVLVIALALWLTLGGGQADATGAGASATSGTERASTVGVANSVVGDVDCSGTISAIDSLKLLRYTIALTVTQTEPCDDLGTGGPPLQGDVDCDADVDLVDSLRVLRWVAGLTVFQNEPCPDIGT